MTLAKQRLQNGWFALVPGLAFLAIIVAVVMSPYGQLRFTYDSHDLVAASESLDIYLNGKNNDGHSYLVRAPLHPFLLSFFQNKVVAFWWINFLSLLGSLALIFKLARNSQLPINASIAVVGIIAMFIPWLLIFQFAWTEALFITLSLFLCYVLQRDGSLVSVLVLCILLFLVRKSGLFFFAGVAVFYLIERRNRSAAIVSFAAVVAFAALQLVEFSYMSTGFFPDWLPKLASYSRVYYLDAVTSWFLPLRMPLLFRASIVFLLLLGAFYFFRSEIFFVSRQRQNLVLLSLAISYSIILICFRGVSEYEDGERYLVVLFPFWMIFAASVLLHIYKIHTGKVRNVLFAALALWVFYLFLRMVHYLF